MVVCCYYHFMEVKNLIVRERNDEFVLIDQHYHASISGKLFSSLNKDLKPNQPWVNEIELAIYEHDCGWIPFDATPFWDDKSESPYSFIRYPTAPKTVLYESGIDRVEEKSLYAALLCSIHYSLFMQKNTTPIAESFIEREKRRQIRIKKQIPAFDEQLLQHHYEILQFFDNLSLYICLNEPGSKKEHEHPFFKSGITLPTLFKGGTLHAKWNSLSDIQLDHTLFTTNTTITLQQKVVSKSTISEIGLQQAYEKAPLEEKLITIWNSN